MDRRWIKRSPLLGAVLFFLLLNPGPAIGQESEATAPSGEESTKAPSVDCSNSCQNQGVEEVKVADEHCGFVSWERKQKALDLACALAEEHQSDLVALAMGRARNRCFNLIESTECVCSDEVRRWENVYTHVLSQKCWASCGWAHIVTCVDQSEDSQ